jgi:hypothetical protein
MRRRLVTSLFAVVLAVGLTGLTAACAKKKPAVSPTALTTLAPDASTDPSADPSASPGVTPTATTTATPTPTGTTGSAGPHSTLANKIAFVWVYQPSSSFTASGSYQFNSGGGATTVTHTGTGLYQVTFGGLGSPGGVAHAQAYGASSNYCTVNGWYPSGSDQNIDVACFNAGGAPADTTSVVNFAQGSQGSARFSYLWAEKPTQSGAYHPSQQYRYDAVNSSGITVKRTGTGRYEVYLPAAGPELSDPWTYQITAYLSRNLCKLAGFSISGRTAQVACRTPGGSYADSRFALSFASEASFLGRGDRRYGEYRHDSDGVENPSTGVYVVRANELGQDKGQVVALATGTSSTYCHVSGWGSAGADLVMRVGCFNPGGAAASSKFTLGVTW